jgi:hypothetical protein
MLLGMALMAVLKEKTVAISHENKHVQVIIPMPEGGTFQGYLITYAECKQNKKRIS